MVTSALFTKDKTVDELVDTFIADSLEAGSGQISSSEMGYLWKDSLARLSIRSVGSTEHVLGLIDQKLERDTPEPYKGVTSRHLPIVVEFTEFWTSNVYSANDELELSEIVSLFGKYRETKRLTKSGSLGERLMDIIAHFFPEARISEDSRHVHGVACRLWDKKMGVQSFILGAISKKISASSDMVLISDLYAAYCEECDSLVAEKDYFDQVLNTLCGDKTQDGVVSSSACAYRVPWFCSSWPILTNPNLPFFVPYPAFRRRCSFLAAKCFLRETMRPCLFMSRSDLRSPLDVHFAVPFQTFLRVPTESHLGRPPSILCYISRKRFTTA